MAKFIRWLGAFGRGDSLEQAVAWELSQTDRQVAAEPLIRGRSHITHVMVGLAIANPEATFARGWLFDAWTVKTSDGVILPTRNRRHEYRDVHRFLKALNRPQRAAHPWHAEASFNAPAYDALVVRHGASPELVSRCKEIAARFNLPLRIMKV